MAKPKIDENVVPDPMTLSANTAEEYTNRGWLFYSHQQNQKAIDDFRHGLDKDKNEIEAWYGLGLALKSAGSTAEAAEAFSNILGLINSLQDKQRANVLRRLVNGHINQIRTGDWDLEKEVWKRS